ncbi:MAG: hypothetical protein IPK02_07060 [Candidatus Accumulibacter sp.]|uniref:Uncharacterized protein n=1 Tax=Candidatus Accumulibacter affinis TaxID=2954384 RepID=A0A935T9B2_9PROT|nr:hypothetical protein [Candidatus Accumulibacter affinis]
MEIKPTRFNMTNPFAPMQQRMNQVETVLRADAAGTTEQLLAEMLPPMPMHRHSPLTESAVTMVTVKAEEWMAGQSHSNGSRPPSSDLGASSAPSRGSGA